MHKMDKMDSVELVMLLPAHPSCYTLVSSSSSEIASSSGGTRTTDVPTGLDSVTSEAGAGEPVGYTHWGNCDDLSSAQQFCIVAR